MAERQCIIIGAGIGGLSTANYLARKGYQVTILEKNNFAGGRCGTIFRDGHRFDTGATLLIMPEIYKTVFRDFGIDLFGEVEMIPMEPIYKLSHPSYEPLCFTSNLADMRQKLEKLQPGSFNGFLSFMEKSIQTYQNAMKHIIGRNYYHATDFFNPISLARLARMGAFRSHHRIVGRYFSNDLLRIAFTFQNIYVGQNPYKASAVFAMLPFIELSEGVWFPKGGMAMVTEKLAEAAAKKEVKLLLNTAVSRIVTVKNRVTGVETTDGTTLLADLVVANADLPYVYRNLLPQSKFSAKLDKMDYTCSAVVFHWALDCQFDKLEQHNIFVSQAYKANMEEIFSGSTFSEEPSFYLHAPAKNDTTAAPGGGESVTVIVPVGNLSGKVGTDMEELKQTVRSFILKRLAHEGLPNFGDHIKFEICFTPQQWQNQLNLSYGATLGSLSHRIFQMGYLRPGNRHQFYRNLYFTGGSTHPGNGVPLALISGKLTAEKIFRTHI